MNAGSRRGFLSRALILGAAAFAAAGRAPARTVTPRFAHDPFALGVASGQPQADGFVLWTRLVGEGAGRPPLTEPAVPVRWQVAEDAAMRRIVRSGEVLAMPGRAHSAHVEVEGLAPDRWYHYRFEAGGAASPRGRARTFPAPGARAPRMRFAVASCQHYGQGHFSAYRHIVDDRPDLVIHVGDYIYESVWGARVRPHPAEPHDLDAYRRVHAWYKSDADLRAAHAVCPWLVTWDDHEVENDYAGARPAGSDPAGRFVLRRAAAYRAYYEHMPLRAAARPRGPDMRLYSGATFGDLARFSLLDGRQYRDDHACELPGRHGGRVIAGCSHRLDPGRSMLGAAQERWLASRLTASPARWQVVAQAMLMARLTQAPGQGDAHWSDGWDGYPAARARLLDLVREANLRDVVVLGGDIHSFWVTDLRADFSRPESPTIASELVTTSITAESRDFSELLAKNPHVRFFDHRHRGYLRCDLSDREWLADLRVVDGVSAPTSTASTLARFVIESGRAGAVRTG